MESVAAERFRYVVSGAIRIAPAWEIALEASGVRRRTNYPRYVPFVYPEDQAYDIDWNYDNATLLLGLRYELPEI